MYKMSSKKRKNETIIIHVSKKRRIESLTKKRKCIDNIDERQPKKIKTNTVYKICINYFITKEDEIAYIKMRRDMLLYI